MKIHVILVHAEVMLNVMMEFVLAFLNITVIPILVAGRNASIALIVPKIEHVLEINA